MLSYYMVLTFKLKHNRDFSEELGKARSVALFGLRTKATSSAQVKQFGLNSSISNQVLRKYCRGKTNNVSSVVLPIPGQSLKYNKETEILEVVCLKLKLKFTPHRGIEKVNYVEINDEFIFVTCSIAESETTTDNFIGVDLNTTGYCAVVANPSTGKVIKLGKSAGHIRKKYKSIRRNLQKKRKFKLLKKIKNREKRKITDLEHKISHEVVAFAKINNKGIRVEDLGGIRQRAKSSKSFKGALNSWSFYRLQTFIEYKAKLQGIPFQKIDPSYTSQKDSRTGLLGIRKGKVFRSSEGRVDDADVNAAFNIANTSSSIRRLHVDRVACKGSLKPLKELCCEASNSRTPRL